MNTCANLMLLSHCEQFWHYLAPGAYTNSWIGRPREPYHRTKNYDSILYTAGVMAV